MKRNQEKFESFRPRFVGGIALGSMLTKTKNIRKKIKKIKI